MTNIVELADVDGRFHASARNTGVRYKVCGENEEASSGESSNTVKRQQVWSTPPSWIRGRTLESSPLPPKKRNVLEQSSGVESSNLKNVSLLFRWLSMVPEKLW